MNDFLLNPYTISALIGTSSVYFEALTTAGPHTLTAPTRSNGNLLLSAVFGGNNITSVDPDWNGSLEATGFYYRFATGTSTDDFTFAWSGAGQPGMGVMWAVEVTGATVQVGSGGTDNGGVLPITEGLPQTVTAVAAGTDLVLCAALRSSAGGMTWVPLAGFTLLSEITADAGGEEGTLTLFSRLVLAGATGTTPVTVSGTGAGPARGGRRMVVSA